MAYIPAGAEWYIADLVIEIRVEGDARAVVHVNTVLVHATSPTKAHDRAMQLGRDSEDRWLNLHDKLVTLSFRGLAGLNVVHDELEHGAELEYREHVGMSAEEIDALVARKEDLEVFTEIQPPSGPDYSSKDIGNEARRLIEDAIQGVYESPPARNDDPSSKRR